jgi:hypothetical protein
MNQEFTNNGNGFKKAAPVASIERTLAGNQLHPAWSLFMKYCAELGHGEIEILKIQDGLPVLAEVIKKKVKFAP